MKRPLKYQTEHRMPVKATNEATVEEPDRAVVEGPAKAPNEVAIEA